MQFASACAPGRRTSGGKRDTIEKKGRVAKRRRSRLTRSVRSDMNEQKVKEARQTFAVEVSQKDVWTGLYAAHSFATTESQTELGYERSAEELSYSLAATPERFPASRTLKYKPRKDGFTSLQVKELPNSEATVPPRAHWKKYMLSKFWSNHPPKEA